MMAKAKKRQEDEPEAGAPEWMVTYGDMMTLLMTFFVLIVSFSEVKEEKLMQAISSFRQALGGRFESPHLPLGDMPSTRPEIQPNPSEGGKDIASVDAYESIKGPDVRVENVNEGTKITLGGKISFDEGRAELKPPAEKKLLAVADIIRGLPNKVDIRGHTSTMPLPEGSPFKDLMELSYARARAIRDFLIERGHIREDRVRVSAAGTSENIGSNLYPEGREQNNRAELIVTTEYITLGG